MSLSLFDQGPMPPCPQPFNMAAYVMAQAGANGDKPALEILSPDKVEVWRYQALEATILATAGGLQALGLKPGSRVLLRLGNNVNFPILFLAAIAAGFVPVPTSTQLTPGEIQSLIDDLKPALVVYDTDAAKPPDLACPALGPDDIKALRQHAPGPYQMGDADRPAYIIYTSGTSGRPRGVVHAHRAIWARRMMWDGWYGLKSSDRLLHAGAFNWTYTLGTGLMDPWAIGATALIPRHDTARPDLALLLLDHKASIFAAAPGVYRQLLKSGSDLTLPDLRHGLSAGEKLPASQKQAWTQATGRPVFEALGMSEVSTFVSASPFSPARDGVSGFAQKGRRIAVLDEVSNAIVPMGKPGILAVSNRDPGLMLGYLNAPDETRAKFHGEWFLTGDMVQMGQGGAITYLGRDDDMMNAGGYRVSPIEVETALTAHPQITESAAAMVEIKPDVFVIAAFYHSVVELPDKVLADWCGDRLARYKCPRVFVAMDELPKGVNNKLRRGDLRAQFKRLP